MKPNVTLTEKNMYFDVCSLEHGIRERFYDKEEAYLYQAALRDYLSANEVPRLVELGYEFVKMLNPFTILVKVSQIVPLKSTSEARNVWSFDTNTEVGVRLEFWKLDVGQPLFSKEALEANPHLDLANTSDLTIIPYDEGYEKHLVKLNELLISMN